MFALLGVVDSGREGELGREDSRIVEGASMPPFIGRGDDVGSSLLLLLVLFSPPLPPPGVN